MVDRSPNLPLSNRYLPSSPSCSSHFPAPSPSDTKLCSSVLPSAACCTAAYALLSASSSRVFSPSPSSSSSLSAPYISRFSSRFSWCFRSQKLSSSAVPVAGGRSLSSRIEIASFNLKQKMRSSMLSEHFKDDAPSSVATNDHDKHLQAERLSTEDGDDDHGKLPNGKSFPLSENRVLTLPTILTLGRVAAIPILLLVFYSNEWWAATAVACIFVLAAITDWLDGFLARRMGSNSTFGAFLDPVADKLMVATTLVLLSTKPLHISWAASLPWLIPLPSTAIIGREITMSAVREWAASQGERLQAAVAVNKLGKWKTAFQMVALTVLLATRNGSESGMAYTLVAVGVGLLYVSAALAIWSLFVYMKAVWGVLVK